jgi:hypothetical protein
VCRIHDAEQLKGVCLTVFFGPFANSPDYYFTIDGISFEHATFNQEDGCLHITLHALETHADAVNTLQEFFNTWHAASGYSDRRQDVVRTCSGLMELLKSLSNTPFHSYLQEVASISENSQSAPDNKFQELENSLDGLLQRLRVIKAADGNFILSPARFEQFLEQHTE